MGGVDILLAAIPEILERCDCQIVVLGTGKKKFEKLVKNLDIDFPDKVKGVVKFSLPLAHHIFAGADFMAIPSRFEPCGLIQLQAMQYGSTPLKPTRPCPRSASLRIFPGLSLRRSGRP